MRRLNIWELETAYPYLLKLYDATSEALVADDDCISILRYLESFVVRRHVCGIPTNRLRRVFAKAISDFRPESALSDCVSHLAANDWPTDTKLKERFPEFRAYMRSQMARLRLLLDRLERSFGHKERVILDDKVTVEHIMPQTLTEEWRGMLGETWGEDHERWLHTVGNLTLTAYNPELSASPFPRKKDILSKSHFELNKSVLEYGDWNARAIQLRASELAERACSIWKRPSV